MNLDAREIQLLGELLTALQIRGIKVRRVVAEIDNAYGNGAIATIKAQSRARWDTALVVSEARRA